jgi:hypothetical protein
VCEEDSVRCAEVLDDPGQYLVDRGVSPDYGIDDAMHLLDIFGDGHFGIDEVLEGGEFQPSSPKHTAPSLTIRCTIGWRLVVSVSDEKGIITEASTALCCAVMRLSGSALIRSLGRILQQRDY